MAVPSTDDTAHRPRTITTYRRDEDGDEKARYEARDADGNPTLTELYERGRLTTRQVTTYTPMGKPASIVEQDVLENIEMNYLYTYDEQHRLIERRSVYSDGSHDSTVYTYDESNNSETITEQDDDGSTGEIEYNRYDSDGRIVENKITDEDGDVVGHTRTEYDGNSDRLHRTENLESGMTWVDLYHYTFDERANVLTTEIEIEGEGVRREEQYAYDERGNRTMALILDHEQGRRGKQEMQYDDHNRITHIRVYNGEQLLQEVEYTYGEHGLPATETVITPQGVTEMRYEYEF